VLTAADRPSPEPRAARLLLEGRSLLKEKKHEPAFLALDLAAVLAPKDASIQSALAEAKRELARALTRSQVEAEKRGDRDEGMRCLRRLIELQPGEKRTETMLRKAGLTYFMGAWHPQEDFATCQKRAAEESEKVRERLQLGPRFQLVEEDRFRLFSALDRSRQGVLDACLAALRVHCENYRWFFRRHMQPEAGAERMTLILFQDQADRVNFCAAHKVDVGFLYHNLPLNVAVVTVQPDLQSSVRDAVLSMTAHMQYRWLKGVPGSWAREGLWNYLVAGANDWRRGTASVGTVNRNHLSVVKQALARGGGSLPRFADLLRMDDFEPAKDPRFTEEAFRGSAWAHVHFLLEVGPQYREAFFAAMEAQLASESKEEPRDYGAFRDVLKNRLDPAAVDADFVRFVNKL
jgi:hypothetical protein